MDWNLLRALPGVLSWWRHHPFCVKMGTYTTSLELTASLPVYLWTWMFGRPWIFSFLVLNSLVFGGCFSYIVLGRDYPLLMKGLLEKKLTERVPTGDFDNQKPCKQAATTFEKWWDCMMRDCPAAFAVKLWGCKFVLKRWRIAQEIIKKQTYRWTTSR